MKEPAEGIALAGSYYFCSDWKIRWIGSSFNIIKQMMKSGTRYVALNTIEYTAGFMPSGA